jgi:hypothetical protein
MYDEIVSLPLARELGFPFLPVSEYKPIHVMIVRVLFFNGGGVCGERKLRGVCGSGLCASHFTL